MIIQVDSFEEIHSNLSVYYSNRIGAQSQKVERFSETFKQNGEWSVHSFDWKLFIAHKMCVKPSSEMISSQTEVNLFIIVTFIKLKGANTQIVTA